MFSGGMPQQLPMGGMPFQQYEMGGTSGGYGGGRGGYSKPYGGHGGQNKFGGGGGGQQ